MRRPRSARDRRRSLLRRCCAAVVLLFGLAAQVGSVAHLASVQHAFCLEHGELTHADGRGADVRIASTDPLHAALRQRGNSEAAHEHDHCAIEAQRRAGLVLRSIARLAFELCAHAGVDEPITAPEPLARRALLRFAPKCSPPETAADRV